MATAPKASAVDKRRLILDAAVRVFARRGFHHCRVSDVADEAGVAYGLVYHYFDSKEEILNTLFLERWQIMLDAIDEIDARDLPARDKLYAVAAFIIDSYRHDPDLMKVIIVEVTRAANSFGSARRTPASPASSRPPAARARSSRTSPPSSRRCASTAPSSSS
jgi:TetR/AcrR family fatty acid metabolism transcriptional regulator